MLRPAQVQPQQQPMPASTILRWLDSMAIRCTEGTLHEVKDKRSTSSSGAIRKTPVTLRPGCARREPGRYYWCGSSPVSA